MNFNDWLAANSFDPEAVTDAQRPALQAAWRASLTGGTGGDPPPDDKPKDGMDAVLAKYRADQARADAITRLVAGAVDANPHKLDEFERIGRTAIANRWSETDTELALLRADRPTAPQVPNGQGVRTSARVLEAALAQSLMLQNIDKHYDERTLDAAHKEFRGGLGLLQLIGVSAEQNGWRRRGSEKSNLKEALQYAFAVRADAGGGFSLRADSGISNISLSGTLANVANKFARESFMGVDQSWRRVSAVGTVSDYKQMSTYAMTGDLSFLEIANGGTIKHGTLGEVPYTNQAKPYGRMLGIDQRDMINDDLGALGNGSKRLGRGGALGLNKKFWPTFMNNSSFFTSGNGNAISGATTALSVAGLTQAETAFALLKDPDGELMGGRATKLLVPTALRTTAAQLMTSARLYGTTTANAGLPDGNPFADRYEVVDTGYLQDTTITGNSATAYYLLADPNDVPVIQVVFLNGQQVPLVESADADFNQLGIQLRGTWSFGVALQEYRGGVRSAGA